MECDGIVLLPDRKCWPRGWTSCEKDPCIMEDDRRCMHSSVYCYKLWQNLNNNNVSVHVRTCQPCVSETSTNRGDISSDALRRKSKISSSGYQTSAQYGRAARCPAEQTHCIKRACVLLRLALEWGTEWRWREAPQEQKWRFVRDKGQQ